MQTQGPFVDFCGCMWDWGARPKASKVQNEVSLNLMIFGQQIPIRGTGLYQAHSQSSPEDVVSILNIASLGDFWRMNLDLPQSLGWGNKDPLGCQSEAQKGHSQNADATAEIEWVSPEL